MKLFILFFAVISTTAYAHIPPLGDYQTKAILTDTHMLKAANIPAFSTDPETSLAYTFITPEMEQRLSDVAHKLGRCGGFELLSENGGLHSQAIEQVFSDIREHNAREKKYQSQPMRYMSLNEDPAVTALISQVSPDNVRSTVEWLSSFPTRYHNSSNKNQHVEAMKAKLEAMAQAAGRTVQVEMIDHSSTGQKSLRARLVGQNPSEIVVLGGHLDSTVGYFSGDKRSPGSDDNASGSADILEAYRLLLTQPQLKRTVDFFWYAGEEAGLLGSAEIAKDYKANNQNVVGVLQLDMTMFPGAGPMRIGSMTDYTSAWMRDLLTELNRLYLHIEVVEDECGYGCSDHASWYRQGYPTLMPFEATFNTMNPKLHTPDDVISEKSNFEHAAVFGKLAVALAMTLGNSTMAQPY